jgi:predicted permease
MSAAHFAARLVDHVVDWTTGHLRQLRTLLHKRTAERELNEEMAWHIELETKKNEAAGMPPAQAQRAALVEFGGVERYKEEVRQSRWIRVIEDLVADLHYSIRLLRRQPALTLAVVTTLALGIGGTAAVFKVVDALFFQPPAGVVEPDRVVRLLIVRDRGGIQTAKGGPGSYVDYQALRGRRTGFASVAAYLYAQELDLGRGTDAERVMGRAVSGNFLQLLGVRPVLGRFFLPEEDSVEGRNPVAVISYGFWTRHFARDPSVLGRELLLNDRMLTVIGVADGAFTGIGAERIDVWIPTAMAGPTAVMWDGWRDQEGLIGVDFLAREAPGVAASSALPEAESALRIAAERYPTLDPTPGVIQASLIPARGPHRSAAARLSLWLALVAAMTLVVACANVANLLLARSVARRRELAVRLSLGATRGRLMRQHLTESTLLALFGGTVGVGVAVAGMQLIREFPLPPSSGNVDARLLAFILILSTITGCLFGSFIAFRSATDSPVEGIREARASSNFRRTGTRRALVAVQVALSCMLLIGTGLFVRSLRAVANIDPGVDMDRLMVLTTDLSRSGYTSAEREELYTEIARRVGALPGVQRTAMTRFVPLGLSASAIPFDATGADTASVSEGPYVNYTAPGYFETVGTRLLKGRDFTDADATGEPVAIFNERMARVVSPSGSVLGRCIAIGKQIRGGGCTRVVGVVATQRRRYLDEPHVPMMFLPRDANPDAIAWGGPSMMIRLRAHADLPAMKIRAAAQSVRADLPYVSVQPLATQVESDVLPFRLGSMLFSIFGFIAMALAAVGLYGVLEFFVTERTLEIGIRRSLGANARSVLSLVVRQAMAPVAVGLILGLAAAFGGTRFLGSLLFGVEARDPISFVVAALLLIAVATVAALVPARRATRVDPAIAMRAE